MSEVPIIQFLKFLEQTSLQKCAEIKIDAAVKSIKTNIRYSLGERGSFNVIENGKEKTVPVTMTRKGKSKTVLRPVPLNVNTFIRTKTFSVEIKDTASQTILQSVSDPAQLDYFLDHLDTERLVPVAFSYYFNYGRNSPDANSLIETFLYDPHAVRHILPTQKKMYKTRTAPKKTEIYNIKDDDEVLIFERVEKHQVVFLPPEQKKKNEASQKSVLPSGGFELDTAIVAALQFVLLIFELLWKSHSDQTKHYDYNVANLEAIYTQMVKAADANVVKRLKFLNLAAGFHVLLTQTHGIQLNDDGSAKTAFESKAKLIDDFDDTFEGLLNLTKDEESKSVVVDAELKAKHDQLKTKIKVDEGMPAIPSSGYTGSGMRSNYSPAHSGPGLARHSPLVVGEYCECSSDDDSDDYGGVSAPSGFYREHHAAAFAAPAIPRARQAPRPERPPDFERQARAWHRQEPAAQPPSGFYEDQLSVSVSSESESEEQLDTLAAHVAAGGRPTQYCECCPSDPLKPGTYFVCDTYPHLAVAVQVVPHGEDGASVLRLARCQGAVAHGVPPVESILSKASSPVEVAFERKVQSLLRDQGAAGVLGGTCQLVFPNDQPPVVWQMHCFSRAVRDAWQGRKDMGPRKAHVARLSALHDPRSGKGFVALVDTRGGGKGGRKYVLKQGLSSHRDVAAAAAHFEARKRGAKGSHAAYALLDDHYRCLQPGAGDAHQARLACVCTAYDDGCRDLPVQECVQHFGGKPLLCANYQMLYAGLRKHADKYGERASHYVKSLSRSDSQKPVYWDALALFAEDMQHH